MSIAGMLNLECSSLCFLLLTVILCMSSVSAFEDACVLFVCISKQTSCCFVFFCQIVCLQLSG